MNEQAKLFRRIQILNFCIIDTALFLDTHPCDKKALEHYEKNNELLKELAHEYEDKYGPLTMFGVSCDTWSWYCAPWPWELEAN